MYYKFSASWHVRDHKSRTDFWIRLPARVSDTYVAPLEVCAPDRMPGGVAPSPRVRCLLACLRGRVGLAGHYNCTAVVPLHSTEHTFTQRTRPRLRYVYGAWCWFICILKLVHAIVVPFSHVFEVATRRDGRCDGRRSSRRGQRRGRTRKFERSGPPQPLPADCM